MPIVYRYLPLFKFVTFPPYYGEYIEITGEKEKVERPVDASGWQNYKILKFRTIHSVRKAALAALRTHGGIGGEKEGRLNSV